MKYLNNCNYRNTNISDFILTMIISVIVIIIGIFLSMNAPVAESGSDAIESQDSLDTSVYIPQTSSPTKVSSTEIITESTIEVDPVETESSEIEFEETPTEDEDVHIMYDSPYNVEANPLENYYSIYLCSKGFKSYMSYQAITSRSSKQYLLQHDYAYTGKYGIRQVNGRYCVALGSATNATIGTYVDLILENGTIIHSIMADQKADIHTQDDNLTGIVNGCVSEFIVDTYYLSDLARRMGDISYVDSSWNSPVVEIRVFDFNILDM